MRDYVLGATLLNGRAQLLSKDHAVLKLKKRLLLQGVPVATRLDALPVLEPVT